MAGLFRSLIVCCLVVAVFFGAHRPVFAHVVGVYPVQSPAVVPRMAAARTNGKSEPIIYVCDSVGNLWTVTLGTYQLHYVGNMGVVMTDIAFDPAGGKLWGVSYSSFYTIDTANARATLFGSTPLADITGLVFDKGGIGYFEGDASSELYALLVSKREYAVLGSTSPYKCAGDLTFYNGALVMAGFSGPFTTSTKETLVKLNAANGRVLATAPTNLRDLIAISTVGGNTLYGFADESIYLLLPDEKNVNARAKLLKTFSGQGLRQIFGSAYISDY